MKKEEKKLVENTLWFEIKRVSGFRDNKPCDEAYYEDNIWKIKINTLEDLIEFVDKYGEIIIGYDVITIYDDYIE